MEFNANFKKKLASRSSFSEENPCRTSKGNESGNSTSKGLWTPEEDSRLIKLVDELGEKSWAEVSHRLKGRVGKQCRERWLNHLKPGIKKEKITEEEEIVIVAGHQQLGRKWAIIAKQLPGRGENAVKNHFYASKRRVENREAPKTYLEKYILSISSESSNNYLSESPDVVPASSSLEDKEQVTPDDGADVGLISAFIQMVDARYGPEHSDQMLPTDDADMVSMLSTDDADMVSPYVPVKAVVSGNYVDEYFSVKDHNSLPYFGMDVGFNVEDDDSFLEASTGWK